METHLSFLNCYIDGGFINPQSQLWSLGGAGVWCPEDMLDVEPNKFEEAESQSQQTNQAAKVRQR